MRAWIPQRRCSSGRSGRRESKSLDATVEAFRSRGLDGGPYTYVWVDARAPKVREGGRIISVAEVCATAVNADGHREILAWISSRAKTASLRSISSCWRSSSLMHRRLQRAEQRISVAKTFHRAALIEQPRNHLRAAAFLNETPLDQVRGADVDAMPCRRVQVSEGRLPGRR